MNRTEKNLLTLWSDITNYARVKGKAFKIPPEEVEDLVAEAYLKAQAKLKRHKAKKNYKALLKTIAWSTVMNELEKRNNHENLRIRNSVSLDALKEGDESDGGVGAESVYSSCDSAADCDREPDWVYLTRAEIAKTKNIERKIIDRFKKGYSREQVRHSFSLSEHDFYQILKKLQMRFDPCFTAYCAYRAQNLSEV